MVHLPKEKLKKWDSKAQKMIFIGYCDNTKGYRFIVPNSKTVIKSRDATFLESTVKINYVPVELNATETYQKSDSCDSEEDPSDSSQDTVTENKSESEYLPDESTVEYNLEIIQLDVKTAFLYGELEENIFMSPPVGLTCKSNMWACQ
ncbi:uncharacterized protein [Maniola hyperantus]|uniref:uncharacterized protein n=1 Tax=Aphantopus hyperantus TaxID=2795564 RepID=UPI00374788C5